MITAAHCVGGTATGYSVRIGSTQRSSGGTVAKVSRVVVAPGFSWPHPDLALLELSTSVGATPVRLADPGQLRDGQAATVYGWGSEHADWSGPLPESLKYAAGSINQTDCTVDSWYANVSPPTGLHPDDRQLGRR